MEGGVTKDEIQITLEKKWRRNSCLSLVIAFFLIFGGLIVAAVIAHRSSDAGDENTGIGDLARIEQQIADSIGNIASNKTDDTPKTSPKKSSAPSAIDNSVNEEAEKEKLLNFFVELANKDDKDETWIGSIARWTKSSVSVGVGEGTVSDRQSMCINTYIDDFNSVSSNVKLFRDDTVDLGIPNIKIYYQDQATFAARSSGTSPYGYEEGGFNDDLSFKRAAVFLSDIIATLDESVECQVIRHEITHGIGFWGHSDIYFESIMSLPKTTYSFNTADKKVIEMLYNTGIPLGAKEAEVRSFFSENPF